MSAERSGTMDSTQIQQLSISANSKMKATNISTAIEMIMLSFGIAFGAVHYFLIDDTIIMFLIGCALIISNIIWFYYYVHKKAFIYLIKSFRGFVITIAIISVTICDITKKFITNASEKTYLIILDDICWNCSMTVLVAADCAPRITNILRFVGPIAVVLNAINNIMIYSQDEDVILFQYQYGNISLNQIQKIATIEMILFGASFVWGVPTDFKHKYFVILNEKVPRKQILAFDNYATDITVVSNRFHVKSKWLFGGILMSGIVYVILYVINYQDIYFTITYNCIIMSCWWFLIGTLIWYHFDKSIVKYMITQFRCNMLFISMLIIFYTGIQKFIWYHTVDSILYSIVFDVGILMLLLKDGLMIPYPFYFTVFLALSMCLIGLWNLYFLTFDKYYLQYSTWFVWLEKEAHYQIIVVSFLILWNVIVRDREGKYFSLIRQRKQCKELFYDKNELEIMKNINVITTDTNMQLMENDSFDSDYL